MTITMEKMRTPVMSKVNSNASRGTYKCGSWVVSGSVIATSTKEKLGSRSSRMRQPTTDERQPPGRTNIQVSSPFTARQHLCVVERWTTVVCPNTHLALSHARATVPGEAHLRGDMKR